MPPADNILTDPDFEAASFSDSNWLSDGLYMSVLTTTQHHTGDHAARIPGGDDSDLALGIGSRSVCLVQG